jgi:hypothetical protein
MKMTRPRIAGFTILAGLIAGVVYGAAKKKTTTPAAPVTAGGMRVGPTRALVGGGVTVG